MTRRSSSSTDARSIAPSIDRRARFVQEYAKDLNATDAAIRAGYSAKSARAQGSRLLTNADIQQAVGKLLQKIAAKNEITVERTLLEISRIAYQDARKMYREDGSLKLPHEWDDDTAAFVAGVETEEDYHSQVDVEGEGEEAQATVKPSVTITRKVKRWDKVKALDQCMAYLGMHKTVDPAASGSLSLTINLSNRKPAR